MLMKTSKSLLFLLCSLFVTVTFTGCIECDPDLPTTDYNITDLYGKWRSGSEYYVYHSDGTGYTWDEADGVYENEAQPFTWEVDESEMIHVHKMEMGADVPMYYIITELTSSTLKYYDAYNEYDTYSFTKVY